MAKKDPFAKECEIKHKNIKTGEHFADKHGHVYTVASVPSISSQDGKRLALIDWRNEQVIGMEKDRLVQYLNIIEAEKLESFTPPTEYALIEDENCRWFKIGKGVIHHMVDMQKFQVKAELARK